MCIDQFSKIRAVQEVVLRPPFHTPHISQLSEQIYIPQSFSQVAVIANSCGISSLQPIPYSNSRAPSKANEPCSSSTLINASNLRVLMNKNCSYFYSSHLYEAVSICKAPFSSQPLHEIGIIMSSIEIRDLGHRVV